MRPEGESPPAEQPAVPLDVVAPGRDDDVETFGLEVPAAKRAAIIRRQLDPESSPIHLDRGGNRADEPAADA